MDHIIKYKCPKCGTSQYETGEIWASGSVFMRTLGFQNKRFTFISCSRCHYTEFYKIPLKQIGEVVNVIAR